MAQDLRQRLSDNGEAYRNCNKLIKTLREVREAIEWTKVNHNFTVNFSQLINITLLIFVHRLCQEMLKYYY